MENYNNENQRTELVQDRQPTDQQQPTDMMNSGDGPMTGTTDYGTTGSAAPQDSASDGVGIPKNYEGGEKGEYMGGDQQTDSAAGYGAGDSQDQETKYEDASAAAPGYGDKSAVGDTDATGTFDQPTTEQTHYDHDTGAAGTDETGYGSQPPTSAPADEMAAPPPPAPKKESFMTKLMDKLPGHHKSADDQTAATADQEETGEPPKQGLMSKIKEKIHV